LQNSIGTTLDDAMNSVDALNSLRERSSEIPDAKTSIDPLIATFARHLESIDSVQRAISVIPVRNKAEEAAASFERHNAEYYEQRQQRQAITESLKREDILRRQLSELERSERELRELAQKRVSLLERRRKARQRSEEIRDRIFDLRVQETELINKQFGDVILLSVKRAALSQPYITKLTELMSGSRIRGQDDIAEELATALTSADLLTIIEQGDAQRLASLLDRDLGQITRAVTYLRDHPDLYSLESHLSDDALDITMFDQGVPKAVEELSAGQRATALLPLILRDSTCPLIIDQPEDDLDNSFIYKVLVQNVLRLKKHRQLIFVTHNANIPVLGDAEQIVVMHMDAPDKAASPRIGSLDDRKNDILDLLEGGEEAFANRDRRYHDVER
jgi:ABC-type enterochelin transport system ATPase subunit